VSPVAEILVFRPDGDRAPYVVVGRNSIFFWCSSLLELRVAYGRRNQEQPGPLVSIHRHTKRGAESRTAKAFRA
jgi:hypothetical protein